MGKRTTTAGYWRQHGDSTRKSTPAPVPCVVAATGLAATADAGTGTGKFLPIGAIPLSVSVIFTTAASGGTLPILDVGLELATPDDDGLANGLDYTANTNTQIGDTLAGALLGLALTEAVEINYGDDGVGVNNTAGVISIYVTYTFDDDGVVND